jgi:hypothetical protein
MTEQPTPPPIPHRSAVAGVTTDLGPEVAADDVVAVTPPSERRIADLEAEIVALQSALAAARREGVTVWYDGMACPA